MLDNVTTPFASTQSNDLEALHESNESTMAAECYDCDDGLVTRSPQLMPVVPVKLFGPSPDYLPLQSSRDPSPDRLASSSSRSPSPWEFRPVYSVLLSE